MNNKGFIATSLIYSFFIVVMLLMTLSINNSLQSKAMLSKFNDSVTNSIDEVHTNSAVQPTETLVSFILSKAKGYNTSSLAEINLGGGTECTDTLAYDGTKNNNLRYVGANPCNYIKFNNELWRIIGVMKKVDDGSGILKDRVKIVRNDYLNDKIGMSRTCYRAQQYGRCYYNYWPKSDLKNELNGMYINPNIHGVSSWKTNYNNEDEYTNYYTRIGLKTEALSQIDFAIWHVRNTGDYYNAKEYYDMENTSPNGNLEADWKGVVALINASDIGFAVGGSDRTKCLNYYFNQYNYYSSTCPIYLSGYSLNLHGYSNTLNYKTDIFYPAVYLKDNVYYVRGTGTKSNPFIIS